MSELEVNTTKIIVSKSLPENFKNQVETAFCYVFVKDKLLILKNAVHKKIEPEFWGVPGGKVEKEEPVKLAALRELKEETSIKVNPSQLIYADKLYMQKPFIEYTFNMFYLILENYPKIILSKEHSDFAWLKIEDVFQKKIMTGGKEALNHLLNSIKVTP